MKILKNAEYMTIVTSIKGKLVVRKSTSKKNKKLSENLAKEAIILRHINVKGRGVTAGLISTPKFYSFNKVGTNMELSEEFISGINAKQLTKSKLTKIYSNVLDYLTICEIPQNITSHIPKVNIYTQHILLLKVLLICLTRHILDLKRVLELIRIYFVNIGLTSCPIELTHGDIHADNIIIKGNSCYLIDFSNSSFSPKGTDLAILVKFLYPTFTFKQIVTFINSRIKKDNYNKKIIAIMIYQASYTLAYEDASTDYYQSSERFLYNFKEVILPQLNFD